MEPSHFEVKVWTFLCNVCVMYNCPFLFTEFSKGMILPKKDEVTAGKNDTVANLSAGFNKQVRTVQ